MSADKHQQARNRQWRELWAIYERQDAVNPEAARMLREYLLSKGAPRPPGRPRSALQRTAE